MAGDWIKVESATADKPEVLRLARALNISRIAAFGAVVIFWGWLDKHSSDGTVDGVVDADVDALVGIEGFARALQSVGWLDLDANKQKIKVPNYDRLNGKSAKSRALKNDRQAKWRDRLPPDDVEKPPDKKMNGAKLNPHEGFDEASAIYPKRTALATARKAWDKLKPDAELRAKIHAAINVQKDSAQWQKDGGQFIPHFTTWINQRRWEDEPGTQHTEDWRKDSA